MAKKNGVLRTFVKVAPKEKTASENLKRSRAAYGKRSPKSEIGDLTRFLIENENDERTTDELIAEFRKECPHGGFSEVAVLDRDENRVTYQKCKMCHVLLKFERGRRKPVVLNG
jgi:hypothetical protein